MFNLLNKLCWPIVTILSDKTVTKPFDSKTLQMKDEHWTMMAQLVPVQEPLKVITTLLCAGKTPSSYCVFPMMFKLLKVKLAEDKEDCDVIKLFKDDVRKSIQQMGFEKPETFIHPFSIVTVLDLATKAMILFPENFRMATLTHVRTLIDSVELRDPIMSPKRVNFKNQKSWILVLQPSTFCQSLAMRPMKHPSLKSIWRRLSTKMLMCWRGGKKMKCAFQRLHKSRDNICAFPLRQLHRKDSFRNRTIDF